MPAAVRGLVVSLLLTLPGTCLIAQSSVEETIFTVTVAPPTSAKDVQLRYVVTDSTGVRWESTEAQANDDKIAIRANTAGRTAKTFKAIAYAPGCQFATFNVEDLATGARQGDFHCEKLPSVTLRGKTELPPGGQALEVEAMYVVRWASKFFGVPGVSISPLSVAKATVETDGSFAVELPDLASDPLWDRLSHNATLMFFLMDSATGHRVAGLKAPAALSRGGNLKVAASYPDVAFSMIRPKQVRAAGSAK